MEYQISPIAMPINIYLIKLEGKLVVNKNGSIIKYGIFHLIHYKLLFLQLGTQNRKLKKMINYY